MYALARSFVSGRGRWWSPAVLYFFTLLAVYAVGVAVGTARSGEPTVASVAYEPLLFPGLFFHAPPVVAAAVGFSGRPPVASIALGLASGIGFVALGTLASVFGTSGNGDSSLWGLALTIAGIGLVTAPAGHAIGLAARVAVDRVG